MMRMRLRAPDEPEAEATSPVFSAQDASGDDALGASGGGVDSLDSGYSTPERSLPHLDVHSPEYIEERLENLKRRPTWAEYLDQYVRDHPDSEDEDDMVVELRWPTQTPGFLRSTLWSVAIIAFLPLLLVLYPCLRHKGSGFWPLGCRSFGELLLRATVNVLSIAAGLTLVYWTICRELPDLFNVSNARINLDTRVHDIQHSAGTCHSALLQWERSVAQELCMPLGIDGTLLLLNAWLVLHAHRRWARYVMGLMAVLFVVDLPTRLYDATFPAPEILHVDPSFAMVDEELLVALEGKNLKPGGSVAWVAYWGCATTTDVDSCEKQYPATFEAGVVSVTFRALDHFIPCYRDPPNPLKLQEYWCSENVRIRVKDKQSIPGWSKAPSRPAAAVENTIDVEETPTTDSTAATKVRGPGVIEATGVKNPTVTVAMREEELAASTAELESELDVSVPETLAETNLSEPELHEELNAVAVEDEGVKISVANLQESANPAALDNELEAGTKELVDEREDSTDKVEKGPTLPLLADEEPAALAVDEGDLSAPVTEEHLELTVSAPDEEEPIGGTAEDENQEPAVIVNDEEESSVSVGSEDAPAVAVVDGEQSTDSSPLDEKVEVSISKVQEELTAALVDEGEPTLAAIDEDETVVAIVEEGPVVAVVDEEEPVVTASEEKEPVATLVEEAEPVTAVTKDEEPVVAAVIEEEVGEATFDEGPASSVVISEGEESPSANLQEESVVNEERMAPLSKEAEPADSENKHEERPKSWLGQHWTAGSSATEEDVAEEAVPSDREEQLVLSVIKREQAKLKAIKAMREQVAQKKLLEEAEHKKNLLEDAAGRKMAKTVGSEVEDGMAQEQTEVKHSDPVETRSTPRRTAVLPSDQSHGNSAQPREKPGQLAESKPEATTLEDKKPRPAPEDKQQPESVEKKRKSSKKPRKFKQDRSEDRSATSDKRRAETLTVDAQGNVGMP